VGNGAVRDFRAADPGGRRAAAVGVGHHRYPGPRVRSAWNRLGHGFGYYDRFLGDLPEGVPRVGLAWAVQLVPGVPVEAWDVPVHALVTEEGVIRVVKTPGSPET